MDKKEMVEVEVNGYSIMIAEPGCQGARYNIESEGNVERILRGFIHSGYEVTIREVRITKTVEKRTMKRYATKCINEDMGYTANPIPVLPDGRMF